MILHLCIFYAITVLFFISNAEFHSQIPNPFPPPKYPSGHRTAVILSGQLRVANLSILSPNVKGYFGTNIRKFFGTDDPPTPISTHLEHFLRVLGEYGGVDLFMYIQTDHRDRNYTWDGDPNTYDPQPGDTRPCELYTSNPIFAESTGNKLFCLVSDPGYLKNMFIEKYKMWDSFYFYQSGVENFLRQLYGMYIANLASKEYAKMTGIEYRYKARLRPDTAFVMPFPSIDSLKFENLSNLCYGKAVLFPNHVIFGISAEDSFLFGEAQDMNHVLDRYINVIAEPYQAYPPPGKGVWNPERHLQYMLMDLHHVCLEPNFDIYMIKITKTSSKGTYVFSEWYNHPQWVQIKQEHLNMTIPSSTR